MLWILVGLIGCYTPPPVQAEVVYIADPCGALSKQITLHSSPETVVTLHREDDAIAEYQTDAEGQVAVLWPTTSLNGVQARVGRANNYSAVELSEPPPSLEPVWRGSRVDHMRCVGLPGGCRVAVDGTDVVLSGAQGGRLRLDGQDGQPSEDEQTSRLALPQGVLARPIEGGPDGVDRCRHATIEGLEVYAGDVVVRGDVWVSPVQVLFVTQALAERDRAPVGDLP